MKSSMTPKEFTANVAIINECYGFDSSFQMMWKTDIQLRKSEEQHHKKQNVGIIRFADRKYSAFCACHTSSYKNDDADVRDVS